MQAKLTPVRRLDQLDAEAFKEMLDSASFQLVWARLRAMRDRELVAAASLDQVRDIRRAQGAVMALGAALALPQVLQEEFKAGLRKKT